MSDFLATPQDYQDSYDRLASRPAPAPRRRNDLLSNARRAIHDFDLALGEPLRALSEVQMGVPYKDGFGQVDPNARPATIGPRAAPTAPIDALARGAARGVARAQEGAYATLNALSTFDDGMRSAGALTGALPSDSGPDGEDYFERFTRQQAEDARKTRFSMTPDPATLSAAEEILGGVSETLTVGMIGTMVGGPVLGSGGALAVGYGPPEYQTFIDQGLTPEQAFTAASINSGFMALMGVLPVSASGSLARRAVTGAGINVVTGAGMRASLGGYLESQGYAELAKQYQWADAQALAIDAILGGAFGALFGQRAPKVTRLGPDGEPVEIAPTDWTPDEWVEAARVRVEEGDLNEAYAFAKIAEERGAEGVDAVLADIEERSTVAPDVLEDIPLTDEEYDALGADGFNPAVEDAARERALADLKAELAAAETGWENITPEERAAVLVMAGAKQRDLDSAPGIPTNPAAQRAHSEAMARADQQVANGEPVNVVDIFAELAARERYEQSGVTDIDYAMREIEGLRTAPPEADSLSTFLRRLGGVRDDGGDLAAIIGQRAAGDTSGRYRVINPDGISLDEAAMRAWEEGYFPDFGSVESGDRPGVRDLLDAIDLEYEGQLRFSIGDDDVVAAREAWENAVAYWRKRGVDLSENEATIRSQVERAVAAERAAQERAPDFIPHPPAPAEIRAAMDDAFAETLQEEGFAELSAEVRRLRALAEQVGEPLSPEDLLFSMSMDRFSDARLSPQENKAVEMLRNGFDRASIADELDISNDQLRVVLAKARKKAPDVNIQRQAGGRPNFQLARIRSLVSKGIPDAAIAERLGITLGNVRTAKWKLQAKGDFFASMGRSPLFRSAVETAISGEKAPKKGDAAAWMSFLRNASGVKKEELDWIGLEDFLRAKGGSVSREEVLSFVQANGVRVEETVLGGDGLSAELQGQLLPLIEERDRLTNEYTAIQSAAPIDPAHGRNRIFTDEQKARLSEITKRRDEISPEITRLQTAAERNKQGTKWSTYSLPGGENYRELLLRLPPPPARKLEWRQNESGKWAWFEGDTQLSGAFPSQDAAEAARSSIGADQRPYRSSHWDEPNVLAHVRFKERTDSEGRRVLAIEEVQSDWHQAGRERGYDPGDFKSAKAAEEWLVQSGYGSGIIDVMVKNDMDTGLTRDQAILSVANARRHDRAVHSKSLVPDAPFKDNKWAALALKRMIRWAAENGFDAVSWIPGDVKNGKVRPDGKATLLELSADGSELRTDDGTYRIVEKSPNDNERTLSSVVGEAAAKQLLAADAIAKGPLKGVRRLEGNFVLHNVQGWEFYDKILVNIANDLGKKYGARVGETTINTTVSSIHAYPSGETWRIGDRSRGGGPVGDTPTFKTKEAAEAWIAENMNRKTLHTLPLTDALREAASEGLPLFSRGGEGSSPALLEAELSRVFRGDFAKLKKSAKVEIVQSVDDVPGLRAALDKGDNLGVPGAVHVRSKGKTYLIADGLSVEKAASVLIHEVGVHHGMRTMLKEKRFDQLMRGVEALVDAKHPAALEARTNAELFALNKSDIEEETLAYLVENAPDLPLVRRLLADIRQWLWKTFGADFGQQLSVDDIRALAASSLRRVAREAVRKDVGFEVMGQVALTPRAGENVSDFFPVEYDPAVLAEVDRLESAASGEVRDVPIDGLIATQDIIQPDFRKTIAPGYKTTEGTLPQVVLLNGRYYIFDGHHRASAYASRGDATLRVILHSDGSQPLDVRASMRSTGRREPPAELPSPEDRSEWVRESLLADAIPGEAKTARQYGFGLSTGDTVVMSVAPEADTGAAAVLWEFGDTPMSVTDPYAASGKTNVLREILPRVVAALEADAAQFDRDAYVFTPATPAHARVYKAALRQFGSENYAIVETDGDIYLVHKDADIAEDGKVLPRPGRENEAPEWDDGVDADARQQAFFDTLSGFVRDQARRSGSGVQRPRGRNGSGERPAGPRSAQDEAARQAELKARAEAPPVEQALADEPDMELGNIRASTALERAAAEEQSAREMSKGYDAVINCAIRHGGSSQ